MKWWDQIKKKPFFIRTFNWEYWPPYMFYWPVALYGPFLALRAGHPCFFSAANPGMYISGLGMESKYRTTLMLPDAFKPRTILVPAGMDFATIRQEIQAHDISYPLIAKPDIGFRGLLVKKIESEAELQAYLQQYPIDFLVQELIDRPVEVGILYYRFPGETNGKITSVTLKRFLSVTGNGHSTVSELIRQKPRAILQLDRLRRMHADLLKKVPAEGEQVPLGTIGNHSKGTTFLDGKHLIDAQLTAVFDRLSDQIDGFYYGRFDIRCDSLELLRKGKNFSIIEVNGICSEPAHIYDPDRSSYFKALKSLLYHWDLLTRIGMANHRRGVPYFPVGKMIRALRDLRRYGKRVEGLS